MLKSIVVTDRVPFDFGVQEKDIEIKVTSVPRWYASLLLQTRVVLYCNVSERERAVFEQMCIGKRIPYAQEITFISPNTTDKILFTEGIRGRYTLYSCCHRKKKKNK